MIKKCWWPFLAVFMFGCNPNTPEKIVVEEENDCMKETNCAESSRFGTIDTASLNVEILPQMTYPEKSPVSKWGKLKVAPNENGVRVLCAEDGTPVQLKGMSSHGLQWAGVADITEENIRVLRKDWNCNIFRIAMYVDEEGGYAYNPTHRSRHLENVVKWCADNGMYVLIDWHVHNPGNPQHPYYRNHPSNGKDLAADFFTYCARRFQNQKHVIFELCNEPNPRNGEVTWDNDIRPYCEDMLKIIRSYDKDVICICGSSNWSQRPQEVIGKEPQDEKGNVYENLMYSYHFYSASHNDGREIETPTSFVGQDFMTPFKEGDSTRNIPCILKTLPIFVTEFGTTDAGGWTNFRPDITDLWMDIFNGNNAGNQKVSWCNWSFSAEGGACAALKWNTGNLSPMKPGILTESGKYIFRKLHEKSK